MPLGIGKLTNLQTLVRFVLAPGGGSRIRELRNLNHLHGRLFISGIEYVTEIKDAEEAELHKKESLDELHMKWRAYTVEVDDNTKRGVIEKLQPHTSIKECELVGYMGSTFPSWLGDPSYNNMVDIKLKMCDKCECLPPLGQLPSLKTLWIDKMDGIKEVGLGFYGNCSAPFPSLKTLYIHLMESWEKWVHPSVDNKAFLILETLSISECPLLQCHLPPHMPSITKLYINKCKELQSLELKNSSSSTSCLEKLSVKRCDSMVYIGHIPLTLQSCVIRHCEKLRCVEFDDKPADLYAGCHDEKAFESEEIIGVSPLELPLLTLLSIECCPSLRSLPQDLHLPVLRGFYLQNCKNMETQPAQLLSLTSLQQLWILQCPKIHSLTDSSLPRNLNHVKLEDVNIKQAIQEWGLHLLHSLKILELKNVGSSSDSVECIQCSHPFLSSSLSTLRIQSFQNLKSISNGSTLPNLTLLDVSDCPSLESLDIEYTSLTQLLIKDCQGLKTICCSTLRTLYIFYINNCPKLESFGDNGLPPNIINVKFEDCDMIEQRLRSDPFGRILTKNGMKILAAFVWKSTELSPFKYMTFKCS